MTDQRLCIVCHRKVGNMINNRVECSHIDCPVRPKAWSDGVPATANEWMQELGLEFDYLDSASDSLPGD